MAKKDVRSRMPTADTPIDWQTRADEYLQGWQRTQADFANFQKRTNQERTLVTHLAAANAYLTVAPVLNDLRRARQHLPDGPEREAWQKGLTQIEQHFLTILRQGGLLPIDRIGTSFDPQFHEAIAYEHHPTMADGLVIDIVEMGWHMGERVLQPAKVRVSKGKISDQESTIRN